MTNRTANDELVDVGEAAALAGVAPRTLRRWVHLGWLAPADELVADSGYIYARLYHVADVRRVARTRPKGGWQLGKPRGPRKVG